MDGLMIPEMFYRGTLLYYKPPDQTYERKWMSKLVPSQRAKITCLCSCLHTHVCKADSAGVCMCMTCQKAKAQTMQRTMRVVTEW